MLKITLSGGDTEVISIYEPAAVRRQRFIVSIDVEQLTGLRHFLAASVLLAPPSALLVI